MKQLGYKEDEIVKIINHKSVNKLKEATLLYNVKRNFTLLLKIGYTPSQIIKMTKKQPFIYALSEKSIITKINDLIQLGYTKKEVESIMKIFPILYGLNIENIKQKIESLISLGYPKEAVIKMTKKHPAIYSYNIENITKKIEDLIGLGYTKEEVLKITQQLPSIYSYSIENIKQKMEELIELGYTKEEVLYITIEMPSIYGCNMENLKKKIEYFKEIGLGEMIIKTPKNLMQSLDLTYARYEYLKTKEIEKWEQYHNRLFYNSKLFKKRYGITKEELLEKYKYSSAAKKEKVLQLEI